ncbi:FkbM family methyltransferase [Morganella morganii]|uniref:FkbM family methyltransferase n=1 Tax=Morganella morganii TaxID=582 RepID=UPI000D1F1864|nr:FkbM family methyltransferase [Morganella morganii]HAE77492.1 FkbM family methyltransferase [Morganella sp. (in: enterobacteria)]QXO41970.1 FkbM family methyltransferase [Morganella morganii]QXO45579.1 FkbM family methyltransferase [Morganella morganii]QXO49260.1 FkbM family methyltransferase [Morganella morganii]QXO53098.1 FkbM family methyltransferase [Morganella morganii]
MENKTLPEFDICQTSGGHQFLLTSGPDYISKILRGGALWRTKEINISQRLLEFTEAPVIYDIGANLGSWTIPVSNYFQHRNGIVYAFEPQRQVYNQLCGNLFLNKLKNCYTFNSAIGDYDGEIDVPVFDPLTDSNMGAVSLDKTVFSEQRAGSAPPTEKRTINTLDTLNMPHASLLKIDAQGMEADVLRGGKKWIQASGYPYIIFSVWGDYMTSTIEKNKQVFSLLQDEMGYELLQIDDFYVAQHKSNKSGKLVQTPNGYIVKRETSQFGMDFLSF